VVAVEGLPLVENGFCDWQPSRKTSTNTNTVEVINKANFPFERTLAALVVSSARIISMVFGV